MNRIISEIEFRKSLLSLLKLLPSYPDHGFKSVSGPGRSGAIAAVYASHFLKIPFITHSSNILVHLQPHLVIDTAIHTGKTLCKAHRKAKATYSIAVYHEPPRVKFWYECF
jgi:hypothetical protein